MTPLLSLHKFPNPRTLLGRTHTGVLYPDFFSLAEELCLSPFCSSFFFPNYPAKSALYPRTPLLHVPLRFIFPSRNCLDTRQALFRDL